jgi:hypothetical protein
MVDDTEVSANHAVESMNGINGINGINGANGLYGANGINGLNGVNGINGIMGQNGVSGLNGINGLNGISGTNGLPETSGLMTTDAGRKTVAYIVRLRHRRQRHPRQARPERHQYTFNGGMGLCPQWKYGAIASDRACQNMMSACLMAHINTSGVHVPLWMDSEASAVGWAPAPTTRSRKVPSSATS